MVTPSTASPVTAITGTTGNPLVDALLETREALSFPPAQRAQVTGLTAYKWGGDIGTGVSLTYSFIAPGASFDAIYPTRFIADIRPLPDNVKAAFMSALQAWANVANVTLQEVADTPSQVGDIRVGVSASNPNFAPGQSGAEAAPPASPYVIQAGDIWLSPPGVAGAQGWDWNVSGLGYMTAIHELGHAIFDLTDASTDPGLNGVRLAASLNYRGETVMSYAVVPGATVGDGSQTQGTLSYYPTTPMVLDVLAAQALYGANTSYHSGNDSYAFDQNATTYMTIWDGGGGDTISIAGNTKAGFLDLRPGEYSDVGSVIVANTAAGSSQITRTVGIAFGAVVENAIGGSGNDTVIGNDADNSVTGGRGNDTVDGGLGSNTSVYSGASGNHVVTAAAGASAITVQDRGGTDGTDTLTNIQKLQFSDQTIDVSWLTKAASLSAAQINALADVYIAYFNRAPDALGLDYWASRLADGVSLADIAKSFSVQPESMAAFPATQSSSEFVTKVYNNVLGRAPDAGGLDYWVGELQNGHVSRDVFLLAIINGVQASSGGAGDAQYLANKEAVGVHFAVAQGLGNTTWARDVMANVSSQSSSVATANALTDSYAALAAAGDAELVVKILGIVA